MAVRACANRPTNQSDQRITRSDRISFRARMAGLASAVDLASGDPRDPKAMPLCAPNWSVTVPNMRGRAGKGLTGRHNADLREEESEEHRGNPTCC